MPSNTTILNGHPHVIGTLSPIFQMPSSQEPFVVGEKRRNAHLQCFFTRTIFGMLVPVYQFGVLSTKFVFL